MCTNFIWYKQLLYIFYPDSPLFSIFYVPFIILILSPLPTYTHTHTLFFFNSLIDEMRYVLLPLHSLFPRNKNILLCNHSTHTKFRITLIAILSLIFVSCPNKYLFIAIFFSGKGSSRESCILSFSYLQSPLTWNSSSVFLFMTFDPFSFNFLSIVLLGSHLLLNFNCYFRKWPTIFLNSKHTSSYVS